MSNFGSYSFRMGWRYWPYLKRSTPTALTLSASLWGFSAKTEDKIVSEEKKRVVEESRLASSQPIVGFKEKELEKLPAGQTIEIPSPNLSHSFLVKQASQLSLESSLVLLNRSLSAYLDFTQQHSQDLISLAGIYEMQSDNLPMIFSNQELYNKMVELKIKIKEDTVKLTELCLLLDYAKKLLETAVETCFLVGNSHLASSASEQLNRIDMLLETERQKLDALRQDLRMAEVSHIDSTSSSDKSKKEEHEVVGEKNPPQMEKLVEGLKKVDPLTQQSDQEDFKILRHQDDEKLETESPAFKFQDNSDELIKISVKESFAEELEGESNEGEKLKDEQDSFPSEKVELEEKDYEKDGKFKSTYKMPTF
eukprot:TRINITY_DN3532_c0_g1_i18.p1 TRINITY_DN3532_c0_g1~~TRINITY_DN3532_c0_g1_i18.p1  ORF type:complete len:366 (-),score=69.41 TRINITY_DN3532_c0_g1_i18:91-1188(-)